MIKSFKKIINQNKNLIRIRLTASFRGLKRSRNFTFLSVSADNYLKFLDMKLLPGGSLVVSNKEWLQTPKPIK